jgi:crossover junction endodeoxyribonuclease RusA
MIELPYPHKLLWPNGRTRSFHAKASQLKKHRAWAYTAMLGYLSRFDAPANPSRLVYLIRPKPRGRLPDKDNASAAMKAYQDGIAEALGIDDASLGEPRILFCDRHPLGAVIVEVE